MRNKPTNPLGHLLLLAAASFLELRYKFENAGLLFIFSGGVVIASFAHWKFALKRSGLPLPHIVSGVFFTIAWMGYYQNQLPSDRNSGVFPYKLSLSAALETANFYCFVSLYLLFTAVAITVFKTFRNSLDYEVKDQDLNSGKSSSTLYLAIGYVSQAMYILAYGISNLTFRDSYIPINENIQNSILLNISILLQITCLAALAWQHTNSSEIAKRFGVIYFISGMMIAFGKGSRLISVYIIIWFLLVYVAKPNRKNFLALAIGGLSAIILSNIIVFFRGLAFHGLIPHLENISKFDWTLWTNWITTNVASYSFNVTGYAGALAPKIPNQFFWISINPLPGSLTKWYSVASELRFNYFTPFTGLGELMNYGFKFNLGYLAIFGTSIGILTAYISRGDLKSSKLLAVAIGLLFITDIYLMQYNLRSANRFLFLLLITLFLHGRRAKVRIFFK